MGAALNRSISFVALLLSVLFAVASASAGWKSPREALDQRVVHGDYTLYYTLKGKNAFLPRRKDGEYAGSVAKVVPKLFSQLDRAERIYTEGLGLRAPLRGRRYATGRGIDLHLIDLGKRKGSTGDELQHFNYERFGRVGPVLTIALTNRWAPPGVTPAHELFHAFQYGYTRFKNRWFLEGTARAVENLSRFRKWRERKLPKSGKELDKLLERSYSADRFWNRLARLCDPGCRRGPMVAGATNLCGRVILRPLMERFEALDKVAARDRGIDPLKWPEKEQRSEKNNPYMLLGLKQTLEAACPLESSDELSTFHRLLGEATKRLEADGPTGGRGRFPR